MKDLTDMQCDGRKETKMGTLFLQLYFLLVTVLSPIYSDTCTKTSSCSCSYSDGSTIDLSPLDNGGEVPKFQDVQDTKGLDLFSWNPCTQFTEGDCSNVAVCQIRPAVPNSAYYSLGGQDSATFTTDNKGKLTLSYSAVQGGVRRTSYFTLTCDQQRDGDLFVQGEKEQLAQYYMELKSKYACPKAGPTTPTPHHGGGGELSAGLSIGSILCIVFFGLLAVYLATGITFQIFVRKQSGRNIIPNNSFWITIPGLIKDGVLSIFRKCKGSSYSKI